MINLKHKKTFVCGATGTGKTYIVENYLIKNFKKPFVYLIHKEDFTNTDKNVKCYIPQHKDGTLDLTMRHLELISIWVKQEAIRGNIDAFIIDEADMFIPKDMRTLQAYHNFYDLLINHRHYGKEKGKGLALIFITRRPQEMTTVFVEQCHYTFMFALDGKNVQQYFSDIHKGYEELIPQLSADKHNFILRELGKPPKIYKGVNLKKDGKITNNNKKSQGYTSRKGDSTEDLRQSSVKNSERRVQNNR